MGHDELRELIKAAVAEGRTTYKALSKALGKNDTYVQQFVTKNTPRELRERDVRTLLAFIDPGRKLVGSYDPDAPEEPDLGGLATVDRTGGDVANLNIKGGAGLGTDVAVERFDSGELYAEHVTGFWSFPDEIRAGWRNMPAVYSIPVTGDSMEPALTSGSYVFVDMTHTVPIPEDIYACDSGDGLVIKRLSLVPKTNKIKVMSDNQKYPEYELLRSDVRVYGRVVAVFQWRR